MNLLNKLTLKNLKLNKKRTIVTIIGIILSVALITAVTSMFFSAYHSIIKYETSIKGDFHYEFMNVKGKDLKTFENNRNIEEFSIVKNIGYANLTESKNEYKPYAYIKAFDNKAYANLAIKLISGRLPKNDSEIVIPSHLKTNGRVNYKVGDIITLEVGKRVQDGFELNQDNNKTDDFEEIIDTTTKTYKIVGIIKRPSNYIESYEAPGYTFITYLNKVNEDNDYDLYVKYNSKALKHESDVTADILNVPREAYKSINDYEIISKLNEKQLAKISKQMEKAKYNYAVNSYLILLESGLFKDSSTKALGTLVLIVCIIIVFTSVFCIKNSFDISITEKTRQYGMLASIGATKKQIKKNVLYEAFILGLIGIPIGVLCGIFASYILVIVSNYLLNVSLNDLKLIFSLSWIAIVFSIILGIITIYLCAIKSARKASKITPINAIRNSDDIKIKSKKLKTPKWIKKVFKIGGEISYKNLKRNRKKYRTTVISIIVCVSVFIAMSYFTQLTNIVIKAEVTDYDYNLSVFYDYSEQIDKKLTSVLDLEYVNKYSKVRSEYLILNPDDILYSKDYQKYFEEYGSDSIEVISLGDKEYNNYLKKLNIDYDDAKDKGILINKIKLEVAESNKLKKKIMDVYDTSNKSIKGYYYSKTDSKENNLEIPIVKYTDVKPFGFTDMSSNVTSIIISDEMFNKVFENELKQIGSKIYIDSNNVSKLQDIIDKELKSYDYNLNNIEEQAKQTKSLFILIDIFLYGFIIVIALIGITNIFNTITTNMKLRQKEFAMLLSIGMTKKEFNKMISLESFFYGMKSLLIGIPIGCILSYLMHKVLVNGSIEIPFKLPLVGIIISILAVFILITVIMKYSIKKINKQNIIETIRNENI